MVWDCKVGDAAWHKNAETAEDVCTVVLEMADFHRQRGEQGKSLRSGPIEHADALHWFRDF
jgi:hypothetical protein